MALVRIGMGAIKSWFRAIEDSKMIDVNVAQLFYIGSAVRRLSDIRAGITVSAWAAVFIEARDGLKAFLKNAERTGLFPRSCPWAQRILDTVNSLVPDVAPGVVVPNRVVSQEEVNTLHADIHSFASLLWDESDKAYVVALHKQRAFDLHTLIEEISSAFDSAVWLRLSDFSKREIKESGRCLALERYTASGFHMLRAIENESRDCATLVARALPTRRDFGDYVRIIKDNGADARLVSVLDNVRSLERNPLVHPEDWLSQDDAINIFCLAQVVFSRLTSNVEKMNLFPPK